MVVFLLNEGEKLVIINREIKINLRGFIQRSKLTNPFELIDPEDSKN